MSPDEVRGGSVRYCPNCELRYCPNCDGPLEVIDNSAECVACQMAWEDCARQYLAPFPIGQEAREASFQRAWRAASIEEGL